MHPTPRDRLLDGGLRPHFCRLVDDIMFSLAVIGASCRITRKAAHHTPSTASRVCTPSDARIFSTLPISNCLPPRPAQNFYSAQGEGSDHVVFMVRHPRGRYNRNPIAISGNGHTGKQNHSIRRCHAYARKSASQALLTYLVVGCSSTFTRLADNLTALRAWCKQCLPGR